MVKKRAKRKPATKEEDDFIRENYLKIPAKQISLKLGRCSSFARLRMRILNLVVPPEIVVKFKNTFQKGYTPYTKGLKQTEYMSAEALEKCKSCRFSKGHKPANTLYDDAVAIRLDNRGVLYKWIRITEGKWQQMHVYNWLKAGNTIPPGYILRFKTSDTLNADISNLELITRAQHLSLNRPTQGTPKLSKTAAAKQAKKALREAKKLRKQIERYEKSQALKKIKDELRVAKELLHQTQKEQKRDQKQQERAALQLQKNLQKQQEKESKKLQPKQSFFKDPKKESLRLKNKQEREALQLKKKEQAELKEKQRAIEVQRQSLRKKERAPLFKTKQIDYSAMVAVRIDAKTLIYAKPGDDIDQVKTRYLNRSAISNFHHGM